MLHRFLLLNYPPQPAFANISSSLTRSLSSLCDVILLYRIICPAAAHYIHNTTFFTWVIVVMTNSVRPDGNLPLILPLPSRSRSTRPMRLNIWDNLRVAKNNHCNNRVSNTFSTYRRYTCVNCCRYLGSVWAGGYVRIHEKVRGHDFCRRWAQENIGKSRNKVTRTEECVRGICVCDVCDI